MIDFEDMTSAFTTISELQCTKIARTFVFTTEVWDSVTTSIEIQFESEPPFTTITAHPATTTDGGDSLSGPSKTSDLTTTATNINTADGRSTSTTPLTTSRSNWASFPTQEPVETSINSTGGNSHKNIVPAAVGGSLGALAIIVLVFLYLFLRRLRRRRAQWVSDSQPVEKNGSYALDLQNPPPDRELVQSVQRSPSRTSPVAAKRAIGTFFSGPPKETLTRTQKHNSENRHHVFSRFPDREITNISTPMATANSFAAPLAAPHGIPRVDDSYSEYSNPFNLDRDFDDSPARSEPWRSMSNNSRYSRGLDPRSTNSSVSGHRASLCRTNSSQWRADRGMSTYSDPFDLEKSLIIDSAPTPQKMDGAR